MLASIAAIEEFLGGMSYEDYKEDLKTRSAVERQMQILTEAAFRLGDEASTLCPEIDWRAVRGMGNRLRHWYDKVLDSIVWDAIKIDLPLLREAVQGALAELKTARHDNPA